MKHVIVIEMADADTRTADRIQEEVETMIRVLESNHLCFAHTKFNVRSAIAATHEMFNAPKWEGGL